QTPQPPGANQGLQAQPPQTLSAPIAHRVAEDREMLQPIEAGTAEKSFGGRFIGLDDVPQEGLEGGTAGESAAKRDRQRSQSRQLLAGGERRGFLDRTNEYRGGAQPRQLIGIPRGDQVG